LVFLIIKFLDLWEVKVEIKMEESCLESEAFGNFTNNGEPVSNPDPL
jgi:hypothetical protein